MLKRRSFAQPLFATEQQHVREGEKEKILWTMKETEYMLRPWMKKRLSSWILVLRTVYAHKIKVLFHCAIVFYNFF